MMWRVENATWLSTSSEQAAVASIKSIKESLEKINQRYQPTVTYTPPPDPADSRYCPQNMIKKNGVCIRMPGSEV